jgi:hypothetical protein
MSKTPKKTPKLRKGPALRVAIAKDVLHQLDIKRFRATSGTYFASDSLSNVINNSIDPAHRQVTPEDISQCRVCVMSAVCVATLDRFNTLSLLDAYPTLNEPGLIVNYTHKHAGFSEKQMRLMETAFEGCCLSSLVSEKDEMKAAAFGKGTRRGLRDTDTSADERRMRAIMRNVIKNNGTFKP